MATSTEKDEELLARIQEKLKGMCVEFPPEFHTQFCANVRPKTAFDVVVWIEHYLLYCRHHKLPVGGEESPLAWLKWSHKTFNYSQQTLTQRAGAIKKLFDMVLHKSFPSSAMTAFTSEIPKKAQNYLKPSEVVRYLSEAPNTGSHILGKIAIFITCSANKRVSRLIDTVYLQRMNVEVLKHRVVLTIPSKIRRVMQYSPKKSMSGQYVIPSCTFGSTNSVQLIRSYMDDTIMKEKTDRFWQLHRGVIGDTTMYIKMAGGVNTIRKFPQEVATWLNLKNVESYRSFKLDPNCDRDDYVDEKEQQARRALKGDNKFGTETPTKDEAKAPNSQPSNIAAPVPNLVGPSQQTESNLAMENHQLRKKVDRLTYGLSDASTKSFANQVRILQMKNSALKTRIAKLEARHEVDQQTISNLSLILRKLGDGMPSAPPKEPYAAMMARVAPPSSPLSSSQSSSSTHNRTNYLGRSIGISDEDDDTSTYDGSDFDDQILESPNAQVMSPTPKITSGKKRFRDSEVSDTGGTSETKRKRHENVHETFSPPPPQNPSLSEDVSLATLSNCIPPSIGSIKREKEHSKDVHPQERERVHAPEERLNSFPTASCSPPSHLLATPPSSDMDLAPPQPSMASQNAATVRNWSEADVSIWLQTIPCCERYVEAFRTKHVAGVILLTLTDQMLERVFGMKYAHIMEFRAALNSYVR